MASEPVSRTLSGVTGLDRLEWTDFDGDGSPDLLVRSSILGGFVAYRLPQAGEPVLILGGDADVLVDLDGDGDLDGLSQRGAALQFAGQAFGEWREVQDLDPEGDLGLGRGAAADLGDGDLDLRVLDHVFWAGASVGRNGSSSSC